MFQYLLLRKNTDCDNSKLPKFYESTELICLIKIQNINSAKRKMLSGSQALVFNILEKRWKMHFSKTKWKIFPLDNDRWKV